MRRLLKVSNEGGGTKKAEARRAPRVAEELMDEMGWWRWCLKGGHGMGGGGECPAPCFRFVKQIHRKT